MSLIHATTGGVAAALVDQAATPLYRSLRGTVPSPEAALASVSAEKDKGTALFADLATDT
jgi:hypothetical protein